ncbi:MAG: hypothetical protein E3J30_11990 [Anaerolineales bacterium]|nr:MAG: hypothetical protein E3J30_11990 [Anaerolineales bacterium]
MIPSRFARGTNGLRRWKNIKIQSSWMNDQAGWKIPSAPFGYLRRGTSGWTNGATRRSRDERSSHR